MERAVLKRRMATGPFQGPLPLDAYLLTDLPILRLDVDVHFMAVSDLQHYARHVGLGVWELMRSRAFEPYGAAWDGRQTVFFYRRIVSAQDILSLLVFWCECLWR